MFNFFQSRDWRELEDLASADHYMDTYCQILSTPADPDTEYIRLDTNGKPLRDWGRLARFYFAGLYGMTSLI